MTEEVKFAAFEGGQLRVLASESSTHEAVLALPLSRLLVRMVRVPAENREDPSAFALPLLQAMSPFPDEPLTVSCETVHEDENGLVVIAAALPENSTDDIAEQLDAAKINVTRIDALAIGALRGLWNALGTEDGARRMVLLNSVDCISVMVLDGDMPCAIRAVNAASELKREVMLSLLEAENFGGAKELKEIVIAEAKGEEEAKEKGEGEGEGEGVGVGKGAGLAKIEGLETFAPVRKLEIGEDAALVGVSERAADAAALNALPASWREMLEETRFKRKLLKNLAIAGGIWALLMGIVLGVPLVFGLMTNHQKDLSKGHSSRYEKVLEMKKKALLVEEYSDHAKGALEVMKHISVALSTEATVGILITDWDYRRGEVLTLRGEADSSEAIYSFKEAVAAIAVTDAKENTSVLFPSVELTGPTLSRGKYTFELKCLYVREEDAE